MLPVNPFENFLLLFELMHPFSDIKTCTLTPQESFWHDLMRGIAFLIIFLAHVQQVFVCPFWCPQLPGQERTFGWYVYQQVPTIFLMTFFSQSGMLIYFSCIRNTQRFGRFKGQEYLKARLMRLCPPLLFSLLLVVAIQFILGWFGYTGKADFARGDEIYLVRNDLQMDWKNIFGTLFFFNTIIPGFQSPNINGPLWSLAHEFWFYMLGFGFLWLFIRKTWMTIPFLLLGFTVGFRLNEFWAYGALVWLVSFVMTHIEYNGNRSLATFLGITGAVCSFGVLVWFYMHYKESYYEFRSQYALGIFLSFLLILLMRFVRNQSFQPNKYLRAISHCSKFAYTGYAIHFPVFVLFFVLTNQVVDSFWERAAIILFVILFVLFAAYHLSKILEDKKVLSKVWSNSKGHWRRYKKNLNLHKK